jgi:hypothetical protein
VESNPLNDGATYFSRNAPIGQIGRRFKLAFFTVYLDDSGTDPSQPIASASALIIPDVQTPKLDSNWRSFLDSQGFSDFHASACAAPKSKEEQYSGWDENKRKHVFMRVREFCKKFGVRTFGFAVYKPIFDSIMSDEFRHYLGGHYTWAVRNVVREVEDWRKTKKVKEPTQYIFDWQEIGSDARDEIDDVMGQMSEHYRRDILHKFGRRKLIPGLQCVDLIAWLTHQLGLNNCHDKPMEGRASESIKTSRTISVR